MNDGTVGISVKALYDKFGGNLRYGKIVYTKEDGEEYYDMVSIGGFVVLDGETVYPLEGGKGTKTFVNINGDNITSFILTDEEVSIAVFK